MRDQARRSRRCRRCQLQQERPGGGRRRGRDRAERRSRHRRARRREPLRDGGRRRQGHHRRVRPSRHPGEQCRNDARPLARLDDGRGLRCHHRAESQERVQLQPGRPAPDDEAEARSDRQRDVGRRSHRQPGADQLFGREGGDHRVHQGHGQGVRWTEHRGQRRGARLRSHRSDRGAARRRSERSSSGRPPADGWGRQRKLPMRWSSLPPTKRATSQVRSSPSTVG